MVFGNWLERFDFLVELFGNLVESLCEHLAIVHNTGLDDTQVFCREVLGQLVQGYITVLVCNHAAVLVNVWEVDLRAFVLNVVEIFV
jgi:hypothetical protein